jgi:sodium/bile acid cotransporter 7
VIFNVLLAAVVVLGLLWPAPGLAVEPLRRELVIAVMFLMSLTLPAERLRRAAGNVRGLGACFGVGYVVLPLACGLLAGALYAGQPGPRAGLVVLGALPCTLASATVWTRLAGGDDALALTYTVLSNLLSVALVPLYLLLFLGEALPVPAGRLFADLAIVVLAPVAVGQVLRRLLGPRVDRGKPAISIVARGLVLTIVLVAVSKMAAEVRARPLTVGQLALLAAVLHAAALWLGSALAGRLGRPRAERIAVGFAGSQKTLFIGVFLAGEYFPEAPLALLPVTAYHVIQLVIDTAAAGRCARAGATAEA